MLVNNAYIVIAGSIILLVGLYIVYRSLRILKVSGLARPWRILSTLISFFFLGDILSDIIVERS